MFAISGKVVGQGHRAKSYFSTETELQGRDPERLRGADNGPVFRREVTATARREWRL
jgi:hypothetical protein